MAATATKTANAEADAAEKKGGKKKLMIIALAVVVIAAGAFFYLHTNSASASTKKAKPKPPALGAVLDVDPISVNLADGHYLKVGISLQEVKGAKDVTSGSRALDATIALYSGQTMATLQDKAQAAAVKAQLVKTIAADYDNQVCDVYFTEYVMQ